MANQSVNGQEYQHATLDAQLSAGGASFQLRSFSKISFKVAAEKKPTNDAQGQVDGFTIDNEKNEASLSMRLKEWLELKEWAAEQYPDLGIGQIAFDMVLTYGNSLSALKTDKLYGVMFQEEPRQSENNQDALMVDLPLFVLRIVPHGGAFIQYGQKG